MGIKEILQSFSQKNKEKKEMFKQAEAEMRVQEILESRKKSANERELERYMKEEREESIKHELEEYRKRRDEEIKFGHNPLDTPNITNHVDWEVLRERNMFAKGKMTLNKGDGNVMKNSSNLLKNNKRLYGI